jgi:hypothetical protein
MGNMLKTIEFIDNSKGGKGIPRNGSAPWCSVEPAAVVSKRHHGAPRRWMARMNRGTVPTLQYNPNSDTIQKTGGLPRVAASHYDLAISLPGAGDGISKLTVNR